MIFLSKIVGMFAATALLLNAGACAQSTEAIEADYCVGVSNDESGAIRPNDNAYIVTKIDSILFPSGYDKSDAPAVVEYVKKLPEYSVIQILRNLGPSGTVIAHFPGSGDTPYTTARTAVIAIVNNEIRSKFIVRDCEDIFPGSTPKLYN